MNLPNCWGDSGRCCTFDLRQFEPKGGLYKQLNDQDTLIIHGLKRVALGLQNYSLIIDEAQRMYPGRVRKVLTVAGTLPLSCLNLNLTPRELGPGHPGS